MQPTPIPNLIAMTGYMLWYWSQEYHFKIDKIFYYALLIVVIIVPIDLICPPFIMHFLFWKLSLHLWLIFINLLRMTYITFIRSKVNTQIIPNY